MSSMVSYNQSKPINWLFFISFESEWNLYSTAIVDREKRAQALKEIKKAVANCL